MRLCGVSSQDSSRLAAIVACLVGVHPELLLVEVLALGIDLADDGDAVCAEQEGGAGLRTGDFLSHIPLHR